MKELLLQTVDRGELDRIIAAVLAEDIGAGDITSELTIPETAIATMSFIAGQELMACGTFVPEAVFNLIPPACGGDARGGSNTASPTRNPASEACSDFLPPPQAGEVEKIRVQVLVQEAQLVKKETVLAIAKGSARTLLLGERVILNLMQRMCGVATLTHQYVDAVKGTKAIILDTRKTMPGLRALDKYAVRVGGGQNHRLRLDDMVLIKDNHIAIGFGVAGCGLREIIEQVRENLSLRYPLPQTRPPLVIECDTLAQVKEVLAAKPDRILLDNMSIKELREAVSLANGKIKLEASGGVSLETVRAIAETGVDYISVGKITHSAPAADIRADMA